MRGGKPRRLRRLACLLLAPACLTLLAVEILYLAEPRLFSTYLPKAAAMTAKELPASEAYPLGDLPEALQFERLRLEKSARRLTAFARNQPVRVYLVALGSNPVGHKEYQGDRKTPEGLYQIDAKNPNSAYCRNVGISYPNAEDRARAQKLGKNPGGDIKIHGLAPAFASLGAAHRLADWTHGCIAVTNEEMEEIYSHTPVGIPIEIVP